MKYYLLLPLFIVFISCNNAGSGEKTFCDTACMKDTLKFIHDGHKLKPYIYISASDCLPDTVMWSYRGMGVNRKLGFKDFAGRKMPLDKSHMTCFFNDTSYAWLLFNDCSNGRGYFAKIPFDTKQNIVHKSSALNSFDKKFAVAPGLAAYTDRGNIFVEDMTTGKKAIMTFGSMIEMDYDYMHDVLDSINITPARIWARVKINKEWKELEKAITLQ